MLVPLILLAVLSVAGGWIGIPKALGGGDQFAHFLDPVFNPAPSYEQIRITMDEQGVQRAAALSTPQPARPRARNQERLFSVLSVVMAADRLVFCRSALPPQARHGRPAGRARSAVSIRLLVHKYWIDQIYNAVIVAPLLFLTRYLLWGAVDRGVINGGGSLAAGGVRGLGALVQRVQSGNIRSYAGWLAIGAAALLLITYFGFSMHL